MTAARAVAPHTGPAEHTRPMPGQRSGPRDLRTAFAELMLLWRRLNLSVTALLEVSLGPGMLVRVSSEPASRRAVEKHCLDLLAWAGARVGAAELEGLWDATAALLSGCRAAAPERGALDARAISAGLDRLGKELGAIATRIRGHHARR